MLNHRSVLLMAPLHGVELAGLLFTDYIRSSLFRMDVTEALSDVNGWFFFFRSGFNPSALLNFYSQLMSERLLFRVLECGVSALCMSSELKLCKDALLFSSMYPIVRDYRYGRLWCTRLLRFVGRFFLPNILRPSGSRTSMNGSSSGGSGTSCTATQGSTMDVVVDSEEAFYRNPPRPSGTNPFEGMPESCKEALRYYLHSYQSRPFYTTFVSGLITDVTLFATDQISWCIFLYRERTKRTSRWRVLKPFFADLAMVFVQSSLVYAARVAGILIGMRVSREPTGAGVYWGERLTLALLSPGIHYVSRIVGGAVREAFERLHPRTVEDEAEDQRMEEEAEEAARAHAAAAHAAFAFTSVPPDNATEHATNCSEGAGVGGTSRHSFQTGGATREVIDYYEVLGISEESKALEIKKAYRAMALLNHPDRVGKDSTAQEHARQHMSVINEAYDTLIDSDKRAQYDASRRFAKGPAFFKKLESMNTVQLAAVSAVAVVGLCTLTVASAYAQYVNIYQRVTSMGRSPLTLFI